MDTGRDTGRDTSSLAADDMSDGTWMTYADLAKLRQIDRASAFKLALRHKWRRQKNNQGHVTVLVPSAHLSDSDRSQDTAHDLSHHTTAFETALAAIREAKDGEIATLHDVIDGLRASIAHAETDRDAERARADVAEVDRRAAISLADQSVSMLTDAVGRADRAEAAIDVERQRADALRDRLIAMQEQLADAHAALQAAEAADARAERAEAGRAEERGRADRAEAATGAERSRADALRERIEALQVQVTARQEVIDAAEATRRAEDERRARGLLARLRAAWRSE